VHVVPGTGEQIEVANNRPNGTTDSPHETASGEPPREIASLSPHETASEPPREIASLSPHETAGEPPREITSLSPHETASEPPRENDDTLPPLDRNEPDWPPATAPIADNAELPAPDENAFATDYRPWRTVLLADDSEAAAYLALDAVTQWADPVATPPAFGEPELPVPALPNYFGGGEP
jgi:hypothetical protein